MTRTVRLLGRYMNADEESLDVVCAVATATIPPSRREIGAGGDVQLTMYPTAITLHGVTDEGLAAVRKGTWTHVEWSFGEGLAPRELALSSVTIEGPQGRDIRIVV